MDTPSSATLLKPRLRLHRRSPSPNPASETTPQPGTRPLFSAIHDEEDEFPTPRVQPKPIVSPNGDPTPKSFLGPTSATSETPAARLRALLARESRSPRNTTPAPPSEADSAAESSRLGSSTASVTRTSLKDIFSRALREPGDTPQKGRPRRNSFDGSSMEITPVVDRNGVQRRTARRSLSDEEAENPKSNRRSDPSFRFSTAVTFDSLRARLMSSQSQLLDQNLEEAMYDPVSSRASTSTSKQHHRHPSASSTQVHPVTQQVNTTTPYPSFQISAQLGSQSNLLEQDSDMQRAMGDVLNSDNEGSTPAPNAAKPTALSFDSRSSSFPDVQKDGSRLEPRHTSHELDSSTASLSVNGRTDTPHRPQEEQRNVQREREWNRPRLPSGSNTPESHRRQSQEHRLRRISHDFRSHSHIKSLSHESATTHNNAAESIHRPLERRSSLASLRSFDDDHSSRPSSVGSQADYRDRIHEFERERHHEREREWNKRQPPSRPSSSLSTSSSHSFSHSHSHPPRSPTAIPYLTPTHASLQRKSSRTSLRSDSPASLASSRESLKERELDEKTEIAHERERNWNSPRPHWSISKSPSPSHLKIRNRDSVSLRPTSSLTRLEDSNGHQKASRGSAELQSVSPKVAISSATSPNSLHKSTDRLDTDTDQNATGAIQSPLTGFSNDKTPGIASNFGWNFARNPLPPLELDDPVDRHKSTSTPISKPPSRAPEATPSSHIPVRSRMKGFSSIGHATSDMSLTHIVGDESSFQQDSRDGLIQDVEPRGRGESPMVTTSRGQEDVVLASDEEPIIDLPQSTTPKSNPPKLISEEVDTDAETEVLTSSPQSSPQLGAPASIPNEASLHEANDPLRSQTSIVSLEEPSISATPPGTPPSVSTRSYVAEMSPSFSLVTPPRQAFGSSTIDFRTPSPPHDLPDLPGPPSSDDDALGSTPIKDRRFDVNPNLTLTKTPRPPGAWAATPLPTKFGRRSPSPTALFPSESTPPAFTSTPLPRASTHPHVRAETENTGEDGLLTPVGMLSRAKSLPLRTPAPPGAWMATPGQSALISNGASQSQFGSLGRKKGLLKVRFDVAESEASATEGHPGSPLSAIRPANPELPIPKPTPVHATDDNTDVIVNQGPQSAIPLERPTTPTARDLGSSPRSLRKSPAVRLVDSYGQTRVDEEGNAEPLDLPNGHADVERTTSPPTPRRRSLVRIVDAMGKEVDDTLEIPHTPEDRTNRSFEADVSVVSDDNPGHAEALARMRKTLKDLAESLSDADKSEDLELNSSHLEQLEEVSQAARLARNQLAQNLHTETAKHDNLQRKSRFSAWTRGILPVATKKPWNTAIIYCGIVVQLLLILAMWRYAHAEARRLFYTTYYDPLYPEFTPIQGSGTISATRSWTLLDSYETIQREGWWSVRKEILRAMGHVGDQAWEWWGEHAHFEKPT